MKIRRLPAAALLAAALGTAALASAAPTAAATPTAASFAYIAGYYPSYASCAYAGEHGPWSWYTCFQSGSVWALQVPDG
ncbi:hypothetical protein GCM10017600_56160 [Streptosporangium carneum]|uniref:Secreted protein n=1 Tax=Streptosporangium carneum TaxID=47481 RepID=A0A9W6MFK2_9ACTN|nr:hypothetical protein GCM10017600_56160 [Streptosporangium carneum]